MNKVNYQIKHFIHKDEKGLYVIHSTKYEQEFFSDYSLQAMKADIERQTGLFFINEEEKFIEGKLYEREEGLKKSEKYLILK